jgi:hypothetical protein
VISGAMAGRQQDGTEFGYGAGDAFALEPDGARRKPAQ